MFAARECRTCAMLCAVATVLIPIFPAAHAATPLTASWDNGLRLRSEDGLFEVSVGGRIMYDWSFTHESDSVPASYQSPDGSEFRRARLELGGWAYGNLFYRAQWDFAGGKVVPKDLYMGLRKLPIIGNLRAGIQYEPFGLEMNTSSNYITFVERGLQSDLTPARNPGIMVFNAVLGGDTKDRPPRATWAVGFFRQDDDSGTTTGDGEYAETARITALPHYAESGRRLLHVGAAFSHREPPGGTVSFSFRPENHLAARVLSTGVIEVDDVFLTSGELAAVAGALSLQGELVHVALNGRSLDPKFYGLSVFGSVFVTGENRAYSTGSGDFSRVRPLTNFDGKGGSGAVELTARYSRLDLDDRDEGQRNGSMDDVTVGANWYLNPSARVMLNYVAAVVDDPDWDGKVHSILTRFQVNF